MHHPGQRERAKVRSARAAETARQRNRVIGVDRPVRTADPRHREGDPVASRIILRGCRVGDAQDPRHPAAPGHAGDADIVDPDPFVIAHRIGGDHPHLQRRGIVRIVRQRHRQGRDQRALARAAAGVGDIAAGHVDPCRAVAQSILHRDRLHRIVRAAVDIAQVERHGDRLPPRRIEVERQIRRRRGARPLQRDHRIGQVEFGDPARGEGVGVGLVGIDVDFAAGARDRARVGARCRCQSVSAEADDAAHARPVVAGRDQPDVRPILGQVAACQIPIFGAHAYSPRVDNRVRKRPTGRKGTATPPVDSVPSLTMSRYRFVAALGTVNSVARVPPSHD